MRTAQDKFDDLTSRGRTLAQIRAIAIAIEDKELYAIVVKKQKKIDDVEKMKGDAIKVEVERC